MQVITLRTHKITSSQLVTGIASVPQMSRVRLPPRPELCSDFIFTIAHVVLITAMITHILTSFKMFVFSTSSESFWLNIHVQTFR